MDTQNILVPRTSHVYKFNVSREKSDVSSETTIWQAGRYVGPAQRRRWPGLKLMRLIIINMIRRSAQLLSTARKNYPSAEKYVYLYKELE